MRVHRVCLLCTESPVVSPATRSVTEWKQQTQRFTLSLKSIRSKSILFPYRCSDQLVEVVCAATQTLNLTGFLHADSIGVFDGAAVCSLGYSQQWRGLFLPLSQPGHPMSL